MSSVKRKKAAKAREAREERPRVGATKHKPKPLAAEKRGVKLQAMRPVGNGAMAPRCQALKRDGTQCNAVASTGFRVCRVHGAGNRKKVAAGEARPTGRPPIHGLYSKRGMQDIRALMDEVRALGGDLDDTDEELRALRAVLWFLLEQAETFGAKAGALEKVLEALEDVAAQLPMDTGGDVAERKALQADIRTGYRLLAELGSYATHVSDSAMRVIAAAKQRAETRAKLAETRALESFAKLAVGVRNIVWDLLEEDQRAVFEQRVRRELFLPHNVEPPAELGGRGSALAEVN